jgi:hypothetical protein
MASKGLVASQPAFGAHLIIPRNKNPGNVPGESAFADRALYSRSLARSPRRLYSGVSAHSGTQDGCREFVKLVPKSHRVCAGPAPVTCRITRISRFELRARTQKPALAHFSMQQFETVSQILTGNSRFIHLLWWPEDDHSASEGARLAETE